MKFIYQYRTADNVRHDGVVNAADKDAAFALLKSQGIKPSRMVVAPGVFNKLFGAGKRWIAIGVLAVLVVVLSVALSTMKVSAVAVFDDTSRRQVIGDSAIVEKGIRTGWASVFPEEGERFLASFAIPGVPAGQRSTTETEIRQSLDRVVRPSEGDSVETRQIKAMVEGMKEELRRFIAAGGSVKAYGNRLVERQEQELGYYNRVKTEIEAAVAAKMPTEDLEALWERRNDELRQMGIKLVAMPDID